MVGKLLAHFQILETLGEGGVGVVYKARDTNLGRPVAIKVLTGDSISDPKRRHRFLQEAKTASAVNHPNLVHIYEVGQSEGVDFIAMEYVSGQTLQQLIAGGDCAIPKIVDYAIQIVDGLGAAHAVGILHRDVKPANIMVHDENLIKILDFGLAKLWKSDSGNPIDTALPSQDFHTGTGKVAGTVAYMSPEQARGEELDERSDLFSLGALLYELSTRQRPFPGSTAAVVFDGILNKTPKPAQSIRPDLPDQLARIISKALERNPAVRYQSAAEMLLDLKHLRYGDEATVTYTERPKARQPRLTTRGLWAIAGLILIAILGATIWSRFLRGPNASLSVPTLVPFTSFPGGEYEPAFSPDGNRIAFVWDGEKEDNYDIYVKFVNGGTPLRITTNPAGEGSPAWSPNGEQIAFLRYSENTAGTGFYIVSSMGGAERKVSGAWPLAHIFDRHLDWAPDGKTLAVVDKSSAEEPFAIFTLSVENGERHRLTKPPSDSVGDTGPLFSPDGRWLAFRRTSSSGVNDIYILSSSGGEPRRLTHDNRFTAGHAWTSKGREIVFSSNRSGPRSLWRVPASGGSAQSVAALGEGAYYLAISRDGRRLAYSKFTSDSNVWRMELPSPGAPAHAPQKFLYSTRNETSAQYSPDGNKVAFRSDRSGNDEIWICDGSGANAYALTSFGGALTGSPRWSEDGQYLAFDSRPGGNADIYVISATGGSPRRITTEPSEEAVPSWSKDGNWIYFASNRTGTWQVWKAPGQKGSTNKAVQVTHHGGFAAFESADGKWVFYAKGRDLPGLWRVAVDGGEESEIVQELKEGYWGYWMPGENGIYFIDLRPSSRAGVEFFRFATRRIEQLGTLDKEPPFGDAGFSVSRDGRWILYTQVDGSGSDIMLVENFR